MCRFMTSQRQRCVICSRSRLRTSKPSPVVCWTRTESCTVALPECAISPRGNSYYCLTRRSVSIQEEGWGADPRRVKRETARPQPIAFGSVAAGSTRDRPERNESEDRVSAHDDGVLYQ